MRKRVELTGKMFGKLIVLEFAGPDKYGKSLWRCKCSCGNEITKAAGDLRRMSEGHCIKCNRGHNQLKFGEANRNRVYKSYQAGANKRNLEFDLSLEEFIKTTQEKCHYCGALPSVFKRDSHHGKSNGLYTGNGIDRKDNIIGYTLSNCLPCCYTCNIAKRDMSYDDFISWIYRASNYLKESL